jgi:hypothetical protein
MTYGHSVSRTPARSVIRVIDRRSGSNFSGRYEENCSGAELRHLCHKSNFTPILFVLVALGMGNDVTLVLL